MMDRIFTDDQLTTIGRELERLLAAWEPTLAAHPGRHDQYLEALTTEAGRLARHVLGVETLNEAQARAMALKAAGHLGQWEAHVRRKAGR